jgi:hypothetical protein
MTRQDDQPTLFSLGSSGVSQYGTPLDDPAPALPSTPAVQPAPNPLVRRTDPETSRQAAADLDVSRCEMVFLSALRKLGHPASAYEVAAAQRSWPNAETVRKRAGGLKEKTLIRVVDRLGKHPQTGRHVERFLLTGAGLLRVKG